MIEAYMTTPTTITTTMIGEENEVADDDDDEDIGEVVTKMTEGIMMIIMIMGEGPPRHYINFYCCYSCNEI